MAAYQHSFQSPYLPSLLANRLLRPETIALAHCRDSRVHPGGV
jgi:hypothetical protein